MTDQQPTLPPWGLPAEQPWFKRRRIAFPSSVFLVFLVLMVTTGGNDPGIFDRTTSALEAEVESAAAALPAAGAIGESVRDGKFAFVVTSVQKPAKTLTDRLGATETAQGMFVIVRVDVTNFGYEARTLTAPGQFLVNDKGQRFATSATISGVTGSEKIFRDKINPGHTVRNAPLLFDVPAGTTVTSLEVHDSLSTAGVKIKLS